MPTATEQMTTELQQEVSALKADLGHLMTAVKDLGAEQGRAVYGQARHRVRAVHENLEHYIEARPISSVFFALGAGFALGSLLGNRR